MKAICHYTLYIPEWGLTYNYFDKVDEVKDEFIRERIESEFTTPIEWERESVDKVTVTTDVPDDKVQQWLDEHAQIELIRHMGGPGSCAYGAYLRLDQIELRLTE
jgi:hypothetical protein